MGKKEVCKNAKELCVKTVEKEGSNCGEQYVSVEFLLFEECPVTIYRRECPEFVFDYDGKEYFDGMQPKEEDVIFKGTLEKENGFFTYEDFSVQTGMVYTYWVEPELANGHITGPYPVKVRDSRIWWHFDKINEKMRELRKLYHDTELITVGHTVANKELLGLRIGNSKNVFALIGAVHAGESGPEIFFNVIERILNKNPGLLEKTGIAVLPSVNADVREMLASGTPWYLRKNLNGVDINRNFDEFWEEAENMYGYSTDDPRGAIYKGTSPASEPETKAVKSFLEYFKPKVAFSYHHLASVVCDRTLCSKHYETDKEGYSKMQSYAQVYSAGFRAQTGLTSTETGFPQISSVPGNFSSWAYTKGIYAADLEYSGENAFFELFENSKQDKTNIEMLNHNIDFHENAICNMLEFMGKEN